MIPGGQFAFSARNILDMLQNYLTIAWRNFIKHKAFSLTNSLGLAVGMAASLLIFQFVSYQLSFDDFHENKDRLYRVQFDEFRNEKVGFVSFITSMCTREIGVRKVLDASISQIVKLLTGNFIRLVLLTNLIAWPLAYWGISKWLENFPFQTEIDLWLFILPALMVLLIALLTVSIQTIKAAIANPVKVLRYE